MDIKHIVVIGASAGGIKAVNQLVTKLPANLPVAVFVVIHMAKNSMAEVIAQQLQKNTSYICRIPGDNEEIKAGHIYLAPPDVHLLLKPGVIRLGKGPHENRWRPSIDVLFRSAAANYGPRVIGIILSGMLDDGVSGMEAIKRSGGICIVQEPAEAEFMDMPANVLHMVDVDHRVHAAEMGYIIEDAVSKPVSNYAIPADIKIEADITERMVSNIEDMKQIAEHSNYTCPDCGGGLWQINNEAVARFRCHTGHVYTENLLLEKQDKELEESLWVSIRMLEERRNLLLNMLWREQEDKGTATEAAAGYRLRADALDVHIERLKGLLVFLRQAEIRDEGYL